MTPNSDLLIVPTLRMSGAIPLLPVHAFQLHRLSVPLYSRAARTDCIKVTLLTRHLLAQCLYGRCEVRGFHCLDFENSAANLTYLDVSNALLRSARIS